CACRYSNPRPHPLTTFPQGPVDTKLFFGSIGNGLSVGRLLKDEVLGSSSAKRINNLLVGQKGATREGLGSMRLRRCTGPTGRVVT
ncbi:unnamed protein product, partial [Arabidopsis halleri]